MQRLLIITPDNIDIKNINFHIGITSNISHSKRNAIAILQYQRRRVESNLAAIMMGYVLVFLICNFPRLMLNIDELARIR